MKEFQSIISAYEKAKSNHQKTALATVVQVDGSAYRRPGARMLVTETGELTGAISGGCLEGDALRKAQAVIFQQQSMLVTYDTTDEDDQKFGIGLGCNGIIQILIEPIDPAKEFNPIELLKKATQDRIESVLVTAFSLKYSKSAQIGTVLIWKQGNPIDTQSSIDDKLFGTIVDELKNLEFGSSTIRTYFQHDQINVFYESIKPTIRILLFGAGNDTIPVAKLADLLGWEVVLIDGRKTHATQTRFPTVQKIIVAPANEVTDQLEADRMTVALLMTHNFDYESTILENIRLLDLPYIGILGPKKKGLKLLERLESKGIRIPNPTLFSPIGLDIGAEGSEEIALAILAEIKAVLSKKEPIFLREKIGPIH
jgi:xanthine/CO dehydrogenase XdhC/CoxF family maturation factor